MPATQERTQSSQPSSPREQSRGPQRERSHRDAAPARKAPRRQRSAPQNREGSPRQARGGHAVAEQARRRATAPTTQPPPRQSRPLSDIPSSEWLSRLFVMSGFVISAAFVITFAADLAVAWPFQRVSPLFDSISIACGIGLGLMSWDAYSDLP